MSNDCDYSDGTDIHVDLGERYISMLNELAGEHYGRNRTQTLRRAIHYLDEQHEEGSDQRGLGDQIVQKLDEVLELVNMLVEEVKNVEEEVEKLHHEPVMEGHSSREASREDIKEVYRVLKDAQHCLSKNGLIERTNLDPVELGLALNTLIDESIVYEESAGGKAADRYGVHGETYND